MSFVFSADSCLICHHLFSDDGSEKRVRVCAGHEKLISSSIKRGHSDLTAYLSSSQHEINVHESCRKRYINEANVQQKRGACADEAEGTCKCKIFRSSVGEFDWKQNCFICGRPKVVDVRYPDRNEKWQSVQTLGIKDSILEICRRRQDQLSFVVQGRLETTGDLPAAEAVHHVNCYREFSKVEKVQQESEPDSSGRCSGRPVSQDMMDNFYTVCDAMDDFDCELYTIDELRAHKLILQFESFHMPRTPLMHGCRLIACF